MVCSAEVNQHHISVCRTDQWSCCDHSGFHTTQENVGYQACQDEKLYLHSMQS